MNNDDLDLRPLTARSVLLSVLLGNHPPELPVGALIRTAELFGIAEGTTRVALSRLAAEGDVHARSGRYRLSPRLVTRQRLQDDSRHPPTRPWRGAWEMAVTDGHTEADLGAELRAIRLAELRPGVWMRPANLDREWPPSVARRVWRFDGRPTEPSLLKDPLLLAANLWDLAGWARRAEALIVALEDRQDPAWRFVVAAAMIRHLALDPVLPAGLLPERWPGRRLRNAYASYVREMGELIRS